MAVVDRERICVDVNQAAVEMYEYAPEEMIGKRVGRTALDDHASGEAQWEQLLRSNQLYGERTVAHPSGMRMRVSYAAHATTVDGRWLALFVTLSARLQPGGVELVGTRHVETPRAPGEKLTRREREVVRLVALGRETRSIAADLRVSSETIRTHVRNAMRKTGAHTRAQLVAVALADDLIDPDA